MNSNNIIYNVVGEISAAETACTMGPDKIILLSFVERFHIIGTLSFQSVAPLLIQLVLVMKL